MKPNLGLKNISSRHRYNLLSEKSSSATLNPLQLIKSAAGIQVRRLYRDRWDKKIAGVCGGLGRFFGVDPTILRLFFAILCLFTAILPLITIYLIAWLLIPLGPTAYIQFRCKHLYRSRKNRRIAGICGGIAEMLKVNATIIRLMAFVAMIITGVFPLVITYLLGAIIIPEHPRSRPR